MNVFVFGAGKLGRSLAKAIRKVGWPVELRPARKGLPTRVIRADLVVLAVRDRDLTPLAEDLARKKLVSKKSACVHVAGALGPEPIAALRAISAGVAQMHPMISFASPDFAPKLEGGHVHVQGDPKAVQRARTLAKRLKMVPRTFDQLDTIGYHAAAGLVANGAAALASLGSELLEHSGVPGEVAPKMLGPLLRSVADNIEALGFPDALTGPVRRGDAGAIEKHLAVLESRLPRAVPLYLASAEAQLPLARSLGDAEANAFDAVENAVKAAKKRL